jgi:hypothetical protein
MTTSEMKSARIHATQFIVQLMLIGYVAASIVLRIWLPASSDIDGWLLALLAAGCMVAGWYYWSELFGTIGFYCTDQASFWLSAAAVVSLLSGAAGALLYRWHLAGLIKALGQIHGSTTATMTVIVVGLIVLWVIGSVLARLMVNRKSVH